MKNLLLALSVLTLCTFLSSSISAESHEIQQLASISSDYDQRVFIMSASVSKDGGRIENIYIESYDGNNLLERKNFAVESFLQNGFSKTLQGTEVLSIRPVDFDPEKGGLFNLQYLEDYWSGTYANIELSLLKDEGTWMLVDQNGQRVDILQASVNQGMFFPTGIGHISMSANPPSAPKPEPQPEPTKASPFTPSENPALYRLATDIKLAERFEFYGRKISVALELSPEGEIHAIHLDMYEADPQYYDGQHLKKSIPIKNLFEEQFESPQIYQGTDQKISPIFFHPLDFNPKDGGTFAIRYKNRYYLRSTSQEVVMSLTKIGREWLLEDEKGRHINQLWIKIVNPRVVKKIVADARTPIERKLNIRPCRESARSLLL